MLGRRDAARSFVLEVRPVVTRCAAANRLRYDKLRSGAGHTPAAAHMDARSRQKIQLRLRA